MKPMIIISLSTALAAMLAPCGGESGDEGLPTPTLRPIERPSSTAQLSIVSPDNGDVVRGSRVDLRLRLEGATIVPQTSTDLKPDEGHVHVLLDDTLISMIEGLEQVIPDVEPGMHRLTVEFVANDHAPFDPRVETVAVFEVRP
jgi:hypothetical protein